MEMISEKVIKTIQQWFLKCIYSYFLKTHDFLHSILDTLAAYKQFLKDYIVKFWYSDLLRTVYRFTCCQAFVKMVAMQEIMGFLKKF